MGDLTLQPARSALLVMDFQPVVLSSLPQAVELLKSAAKAVETVRKHNGAIGYVRVAFAPADYAAVPQTNKTFTAVAAAQALSASQQDTAIHPDVAPRPGDIVVRKTRVSAFSTTDLHRQLNARGIDTLILAGVHTSGVILSTVREAADRDYRVVIVEDCVADPDPEVHDLLMRKIFPRQAFLTTTDELDHLFADA
jgi:nicotinamidase-related amidase